MHPSIPTENYSYVIGSRSPVKFLELHLIEVFVVQILIRFGKIV